MDLLTHVVVPLGLFTLLKRPVRQRAAAALGGMAPDLDALWGWASRLDGNLYPLVHRGFSHTLLFAPLLALLVLFLLSRPSLHRRLPLTGVFQLTPDAIGPLWFGAFSHLVLDALTITGVPLLWPLDAARYGPQWFFFSVPYMLPVSLVLLVQVARRKASPRLFRVGLLTLLAIVAAAGVVRTVSYPPGLEGDEHVNPGLWDWHWTVSERNGTGVLVRGYDLGEPRGERFLPEANRTQAQAAIDACQGLPGYRAWSWSLWGLAVANASRAPDEGWDVGFGDSGRRDPSLPARLDFLRPRGDTEQDEVRCHVDPAGRASLEREPGWIGS